MMDALLVTTLACLCVTAISFMLCAANVIAVKSVGTYPDSKDRPLVSVIVPARNEERNIRACVVSLLVQDYAALEVLVVNDHSEDGTAQILAELQASQPRLTVLEASALPPGWMGKNWACHEGCGRAQGDILVFTDADTEHSPQFIGKAVAALLAEEADFVTVIPRFAIVSLAEKVIMPLLLWLAYSVFPFGLMNQGRLRLLAYANGAFLMFRRDAYRRVGGHAAVRDNVVDDLTLGMKSRQAGLRCIVVNGAADLACRMYTSLQEIYAGFAKNLFRLFSNSMPRAVAAPLFAFFWLLFACIYLLPVIVAAGCCAASGAGLAAGLCLLIALCSFVLVNARFRYPRVLAFLYPAGILLLFTIAMNSLVKTLQGETQWKGRSLHPDGGA